MAYLLGDWATNRRATAVAGRLGTADLYQTSLIFHRRLVAWRRPSPGDRSPSRPIVKWVWGLRNVSPSLDLCDHFPGSGILQAKQGLVIEGVLFWGTLLKIDVIGTISTPIIALMVRPKIGILP